VWRTGLVAAAFPRDRIGIRRMLTGAKTLIRGVLSPKTVRRARDRWEDIRDWIDVFAFRLSFVLARQSPPKVLIYFGFAIGDDLLCTAVLRELRKRGRDDLVMISDHAGLFDGNPDPAAVRPLWARYYRDGSTVSICRRFARIWGAEYWRPEYAPPDGNDGRKQPSRHLLAEMAANAGISGPVSIRPYLTLTEAEKAKAAWAAGHIVIHSSGAAARLAMTNKEWYPERFQDVINRLRGEMKFIQLGSSGDPPLQGAVDMRGATSLRESAAILHHARLFVGLEGLLMHMARAVDCPAVIVFGGRSEPSQGGYICNENLYSAVPCAPCWLGSRCDFERRCMRNITAGDAVAAIRRMLDRPRGPLAVETVTIAPDGAAVRPRSNFSETP